jgi:hypothetical protein
LSRRLGRHLLRVDDQLDPPISGPAGSRGVGDDRVVRSVGDDEQLPCLERRSAAEEVEYGTRPGDAELMRRAPGGVLERLGVGVPLNTAETSVAVCERSAAPEGSREAVPGSKSLSAGISIRTTEPSSRDVTPGIAR